MTKITIRALILFSIGVLSSSQTPSPESRAATQLENRAIQDLVKKIIKKHNDKELEALEAAEAQKVFRTIEQKERLKKYKTLIAEKSNKAIKVAILGQTAVDLSSTGYDPEILADLLYSIKKNSPKAIFLAGNLLSTLIPSNGANLQEKQGYIDQPAIKNVFNETIEKQKGYYKSEYFKQNLKKYIDFLQKHVGNDIPIYPTMGVQEAIGPDTAEIFREFFHLDAAVILNSNQLVYTVVIGNTLFIMLSTDYFDKATGRIKVDTLSSEALQWLEETLNTQSDKHDFLFVIASDPVFPTTAPFGIRQGLEAIQIKMNKFWELLVQFNVRAYFCGGEVLYDRSFKKGGWQIITGGGGTPHEYLSDVEDTFYHFVLMNIPSSALQNPKVEVFNSSGEQRDQFELTKTAPFLYQYRISREE